MCCWKCALVEHVWGYGLLWYVVLQVCGESMMRLEQNMSLYVCGVVFFWYTDMRFRSEWSSLRGYMFVILYSNNF